MSNRYVKLDGDIILNTIIAESAPDETWVLESTARAAGAKTASELAPQPVPERVSRSQAKAALHLAGLLTQVEALMSAPETDAIAAIFWREEPHFDRNSALIASMGAQLGLTEAQIDELFVTAAGINP
jgi:hypothetical protein